MVATAALIVDNATPKAGEDFAWPVNDCMCLDSLLLLLGLELKIENFCYSSRTPQYS